MQRALDPMMSMRAHAVDRVKLKVVISRLIYAGTISTPGAECQRGTSLPSTTGSDTYELPSPRPLCPTFNGHGYRGMI
jgi:hypothetical protein